MKALSYFFERENGRLMASHILPKMPFSGTVTS